MNQPNTYVRLNELLSSAELLLQQTILKAKQIPLIKTTQNIFEAARDGLCRPSHLSSNATYP